MEEPNLKGIIDDDVIERFEGCNVFYNDIINTQLIKTLKELIVIIKEQKKEQP